MWRAMNSLLVLRDQVNAFAPNRDRASDGLVGDAAHQATTSDHNPHDVDGVGRDIVTALDLTHDPAGGFDSYRFAETLRRNRDRRIKYVISNGRMFSSYATSSYAPFAWRPYSGADQHTGHVHVSVLDAPISDTRTLWNLDGLDDDMTPAEFVAEYDKNGTFTKRTQAAAWGYQDAGQPNAHDILLKPDGELRGTLRRVAAGVDALKAAPASATVDVAALAEALRPHLEAAAEAAVKRVLGAVDGATPAA